MSPQAAPFRFDLITLFPEFFAGPLTTGLLGRSFREGRFEVGYAYPRSFATDRHHSVDDTPYGGGAGMLMKVGPLSLALEAARGRGAGPAVLLSPQGRALEQADLVKWASGDHLILISGRYEGFDERFRTQVDDEVSLGDFVLTGGEYAALTLIDGVVRLLPGTVGNQVSVETDSFSAGLLEHPQYTRPEVFNDQSVPDMLLSGHHARIEAWRRTEQLRRTQRRRPDMLEGAHLSDKDRVVLNALRVEDGLGKHLSLVIDETMASELSGVCLLAKEYGLGEVLCLSDASDAAADGAASDVRFKYVSGAEALLAHIGPDALWVTLEPRKANVSSVAKETSPRVLQRALREARSVCLLCGEMQNLRSFESLSFPVERLPSPRQGGLEIQPIAQLAVLLDRIVSEG